MGGQIYLCRNSLDERSWGHQTGAPTLWQEGEWGKEMSRGMTTVLGEQLTLSDGSLVRGWGGVGTIDFTPHAIPLLTPRGVVMLSSDVFSGTRTSESPRATSQKGYESGITKKNVNRASFCKSRENVFRGPR